MNPVSVFISYAHEDRGLAQDIQRRLGERGFQVWIDEGSLRAGDSLIEAIATAIHEMEFVVALITEASATSNWCQKEIALALTSGLNREGVKVLPIRVDDTAIPITLEDTYCLPLDSSSPEASLERLIEDIESHHADRHSAIAAGVPLPTSGAASQMLTQPPTPRVASTEITFSAPEPVRIIGIVKEGVGRPRNDGTRGSALYRIPLRLSRRPSTLWGQLFVECWNHPPSWSTMHRPGIASVAGDTIVLDGTTLDELEKVHIRTLRLCVDQANGYEDERLRKQWDQDTREARALQEHQRIVDEAADRIRFDDGD